MPRVLLVEDEADVRELIEDALTEHGLQVRSADRDVSAMKLLEGEARSFAALVTDINLGQGVTGFDVARAARELNPDVRVVYISGHAAHVDRFGVEGAVMFPKPFSPAELARQVAEIIGPEEA